MKKKNSWLPVEVKELYKGYFVAVFRDNRDEEAILELYRNNIYLSAEECWVECSGDWPGCKPTCPIYNIPLTKYFFDSRRRIDIKDINMWNDIIEEQIVYGKAR